MHRTALILLLTAASATAQVSRSQASHSQASRSQASQSQASHSQLTSPDCPVSLYAQRQSTPIIVSASQAHNTGPSQTLHVTLTRTGTPPIASIEATLHGLSPDPQILPVAAKSAADLTKTFRLQRQTGDASLTSFNVSMSRVGTLRWIDITSITYADGTSWHAAQPSLCRAIPDPFVLVAGR